jgi:hypothetical protein
MIVIWGIRRRLANLAMLTLACRNGHVAAHRLFKVTRWFTLFFVPLVPVGRSYYSVCAQCGLQVKWGREDAEAAAQAAGAAPAPGNVDPVAPPLPSGQVFAAHPHPPAGWYPDPAGTRAQRYWDGAAWTDQVSSS